MGKAARRHTRELRRSGEAARFGCGHCPGVSFKWRNSWNEARKDWERHNHDYHTGNR